VRREVRNWKRVFQLPFYLHVVRIVSRKERADDRITAKRRKRLTSSLDSNVPEI
jgi:hypothetical protein